MASLAVVLCVVSAGPAHAAGAPTAVDRVAGEMQAGLGVLAYASRMVGITFDMEQLAALCLSEADKTAGDLTRKTDACLTAATRALSTKWTYERVATTTSQTVAVGIGVVVTAIPAGLAITDVVPGSPADAAGIARGDTIVTVDDKRLEGSSLDDGVRLLRGAAGSSVRIAVACPGCSSERQLTLARKETGQQPFYGTVMRDAWYVQIRSYGGTLDGQRGIAPRLREMRGALPRDAARGATVIDLRGSTGGIAPSIVDTSTVFLPVGMPVLYTVSADRTEALSQSSGRDSDDASIPRGPLIVLVDHDTGNGSEWLAESLRSYGGAVLVGEQTAGRVTVRRGIEPFAGARILFPVGQLFGSGGGVLQDVGVQPDVLLDKARLTDMTLGKPPAWLRGWLVDEMPAALRARAERSLSSPLAWRGDGVDTAARALCVGSTVAPIGADFPALSARGSDVRVETTAFTGRILSTQNDEPAADEAAAQVVADRKRLQGLIDMSVAEERKGNAADRSGSRKDSQRAGELRGWRARLALVVDLPVGSAGVHVYRYENGDSAAVWRSAGTNHRIELELAADESSDKVVAAYAAVVARLRARPDDAPPPAISGVCLANAFLAVGDPVRRIEWTGQWRLSGVDDSVVEWRGHFDTVDGADVVEGRQNAETWLLEPVRSCETTTAPALANEPIGGLAGVTRTSTLGGPNGCRVVRSISRLPRADSPGFDYAAGITLKGLPAEQARTAEATWRLALRHLAVLATPAAPAGGRASKAVSPAEQPILSEPTPQPPRATPSR